MRNEGTGNGPDLSGGATIKSVDTSFDIIACLEKYPDGAGVTDIGAETGLSKSTVYKHLQTLLHREVIVKNGQTYRLGLRFLDIGGRIRQQIEGTTKIKDKLEEITDEVGESAHFAVEEHGYAVVLLREMGPKGVFSQGRVGKRFHMHQTAAGKAILSQLSTERVNEIVERHGLPKSTENTITDQNELHDELETIRERGFAINDEESTEGLRAVGIPVNHLGGSVLGTFAVAGPTHRMVADRVEGEIPETGLSVVNELELNLAYS